MLEKEHIDWYWEAVVFAQAHALGNIRMAQKFAESKSCSGCNYCGYVKRHTELVEEVSTRLLAIVKSLEPGMYPEKVFAKHYSPELSVYRGFIDDAGNYISMYQGMDHDRSKAMYMEEYGRERAYKLIKITGSYARNKKAIVAFADRKAPPSEAQFETLRELMIDATGELAFQFVYDPTHPH